MHLLDRPTEAMAGRRSRADDQANKATPKAPRPTVIIDVVDTVLMSEAMSTTSPPYPFHFPLEAMEKFNKV